MLDPSAHALVIGDVRIALSPTEFRLLATLAARPGQVVRRAGLVGFGVARRRDRPSEHARHVSCAPAAQAARGGGAPGDRDGPRRRLRAEVSVRARLLLVSLATLAVGLGALVVLGNVLLAVRVRDEASNLLRAHADAQLAALDCHSGGEGAREP